MPTESLRKSSRKPKPVTRLGDSPDPTPPTSPSPARRQQLLVSPEGVDRPQPVVLDDAVPTDVPVPPDVFTRPWEGYTKNSLYERWQSGLSAVDDQRMTNSTLRRAVDKKDKELVLYTRKLRILQNDVDKFGTVRTKVEKLVLEKGVLDEKILSFKTVKQEILKKGKQSLVDVNGQHRLAVVTLKAQHEIDVGKLKLEIATQKLQITAQTDVINRHVIHISELTGKIKKYDKYKAMEMKAEIQNRAYLNRADIRYVVC